MLGKWPQISISYSMPFQMHFYYFPTHIAKFHLFPTHVGFFSAEYQMGIYAVPNALLLFPNTHHFFPTHIAKFHLFPTHIGLFSAEYEMGI
jgi:hypothetical protein